MKNLSLPIWTIVAPVVAWLAYFGLKLDPGEFYKFILAVVLVASVLAAVHHAEVVAHRVGEPFGTLILALAITIIEVALIVSIMLSGGPGIEMLARDTVFAAVMIILTGIVGLCLLAGAIRFKEQSFRLQGVSASLITLTAILVLTLVLPNYTTGESGPSFTPVQMGFVAVVSLVLYGAFVLVQTVRHRDFFLPKESHNQEEHADPPSKQTALVSMALLVLCLGIVVILAKSLAYDIEVAVLNAGAPKSLVGVIIAAVVLLPEGMAAYKAARNNRIQTSLNLALGSALASIGLTIPAVTAVAMVTGLTVTLGIDAKATVLLFLSLFTVTISLANGKTNILQGIVLLVIFAVYLFTIVAP